MSRRCLASPKHFDDGTDCPCYRGHTNDCASRQGLTCTCDGRPSDRGGERGRVTLTDYVIEVRLRVDSRDEEGDEADLVEAEVRAAMRDFRLDGCKVTVGPMTRRLSLTMGADHPSLSGANGELDA